MKKNEDFRCFEVLNFLNNKHISHLTKKSLNDIIKLKGEKNNGNNKQ